MEAYKGDMLLVYCSPQEQPKTAREQMLQWSDPPHVIVTLFKARSMTRLMQVEIDPVGRLIGRTALEELARAMHAMASAQHYAYP
jgi:hypothetical protein